MRSRHTPAPSRRRGLAASEELANPWLTAAHSAPAAGKTSAAVSNLNAGVTPLVTGPPEPHRTLPTPPAMALLQTHIHGAGARVWWLGAHGGAGESTLTALMADSHEAEHAWPEVSGDPPAVVLVARPTAHGLHRAQAACTQWATGATPTVRLLGLVLIADAPGRPPAPLHALSKVVAGGAPRVWRLPWIESLRLGADPAHVRPVRAVSRLIRDVTALTAPTNPPPSSILEEVPHAAHAAARI